MGDPLRTVIEAPTKLGAEENAARTRLQRTVGASRNQQTRPGSAGKQPDQPPERKPARAHSHLIMQTPTTAELRTAIQVLDKLGERLTAHANHSMIEMPEYSVGQPLRRTN